MTLYKESKEILKNLEASIKARKRKDEKSLKRIEERELNDAYFIKHSILDKAKVKAGYPSYSIGRWNYWGDRFSSDEVEFRLRHIAMSFFRGRSINEIEKPKKENELSEIEKRAIRILLEELKRDRESHEQKTLCSDS